MKLIRVPAGSLAYLSNGFGKNKKSINAPGHTRDTFRTVRECIFYASELVQKHTGYIVLDISFSGVAQFFVVMSEGVTYEE